MTWQELTQLYTERISRSKEHKRKELEKSWLALHPLIEKKFPEWIANPLLLIELGSWKSYEMLKPFNPESAYDSFRIIGKIMKAEKKRMAISKDANADLMIFTYSHVIDCFVKWLAAKQCTNIKPIYFSEEYMRLTANIQNSTIKSCEGKTRLYAEAIPSVWKMNANGNYLKKVGIKTRFAQAVFLLIDKMNADKEVFACLAVADDTSTHEAMQPYLSWMKKLNIKVFFVKSAQQVSE